MGGEEREIEMINIRTKILIVLCIVLTICCLYLALQLVLKRPQSGRYQLGTYSSGSIVLDTTTGNAWIVVPSRTGSFKFKMVEVESPFNLSQYTKQEGQ